MTNIETLREIISDPFFGPFEGEDYWIDGEGIIQVPDNNVVLAATILRKANNSGEFTTKLVKIGQRGDSILLGFDTLLDVDPVYTIKIGFKGDTLAEIKKDTAGKFCLYLNKKRATRMFSKLVAAKSYLKKLDRDLLNEASEPELVDD